MSSDTNRPSSVEAHWPEPIWLKVFKRGTWPRLVLVSFLSTHMADPFGPFPAVAPALGGIHHRFLAWTCSSDQNMSQAPSSPLPGCTAGALLWASFVTPAKIAALSMAAATLGLLLPASYPTQVLPAPASGSGGNSHTSSWEPEWNPVLPRSREPLRAAAVPAISLPPHILSSFLLAVHH